MKRLLLALFLATSLSALFFFHQPKPLSSAQPTNIKDTLSSSQLSYFARLGTGNSTADSIIRVATTGNPSNNTRNLFIGDTLGIGRTGDNAGILIQYIIQDIGDTAAIELTTGLGSSNAFTGLAVVATRSAIHTVAFTPQTNITGGAWQFLIKATSRDSETQNDGIPDQQGFDLGMDVGALTTGPGTRLKTADITCPWGATASVGTTVGVVSGTTTNYYHVIQCTLATGTTNPIGVGGSIVVGRALSAGSQLTNPSAALNHLEGSAGANGSAVDIYNFLIRHLDSDSNLIDADTVQGRVAVIESVRVTATVDPTITFAIGTSGVSSVGSSACGIAMDAGAANTTPATVSFGSLALASFNDLAHHLSCITNGSSYVVTVYESGVMTHVGTGDTIPDTNCDGSCSTTTAAAWDTDNTHSEWGYTIDNINVGTSVFEYTSGYKAFAQGAANAKEIFKNNSTPTATETAWICYRLTASTSQRTGNYENHLTYTATATF